MAEYIDRAEYCEKYCRCSNEYCDRQSCPIWKAPTADVAPVVRSRWRYCGFLLECQSCGEIYSVHGANSGKSWNFCPNCGAKMDLEDGGGEDAAD